MIRIYTQSDSVLIKPFDKSNLPDTARLFNSGGDVRYATGLDHKISIPELEQLFTDIDNDDNSFMTCIYIKVPGVDQSDLPYGGVDHCKGGLLYEGADHCKGGLLYEGADHCKGGLLYEGVDRSGLQLRFAGICYGILSGHAVWIKQLSILPEYRRRGIGSTAAELLMEYMKNSRVTAVAYISVLEKNKSGLAFWRKLGFFEVTGFKKGLFAEKNPHHVIIMQKKI